MGFNKPKKEENEKVEKVYTPLELNMAEKALNEAGSEQQWLVDKGAIRVDEDGRWVILGLLGASIYKECQNIMEALHKRWRKRKYAEDMRVFELTGEMPVNEGLEKLKQASKTLFGNK